LLGILCAFGEKDVASKLELHVGSTTVDL